MHFLFNLLLFLTVRMRSTISDINSFNSNIGALDIQTADCPRIKINRCRLWLFSELPKMMIENDYPINFIPLLRQKRQTFIYIYMYIYKYIYRIYIYIYKYIYSIYMYIYINKYIYIYDIYVYI